MRHVEVTGELLAGNGNHHVLHQGVQKLVEFPVHQRSQSSTGSTRKESLKRDRSTDSMCRIALSLWERATPAASSPRPVLQPDRGSLRAGGGSLRQPLLGRAPQSCSSQALAPACRSLAGSSPLLF